MSFLCVLLLFSVPGLHTPGPSLPIPTGPRHFPSPDYKGTVPRGPVNSPSESETTSEPNSLVA